MAGHNLTIWQIPADCPFFREFGFTSWQQTIKASGRETVPRERYRMVWSETLDAWPDLDDIYERFNLEHPDHYAGRSLSISDLVEIDDELYFCDEYRWRRVYWTEEAES